MKIIVTIPAYNEEKTIKTVIEQIKTVMNKQQYNYVVLVANDGSTDKTAQVAQQAGALVVSHPKNYGLAETFNTEIQYCLEHGADVIVHIDADMQYVPDDIPKLINKLKEGNDLVLGSRFAGTIESMPIIKRVGNKAFSHVISRIVGMRITDGQTGFRAFTRKLAKEITIISKHTYTQEQIIKAVRQKFKIAEVPVYFAKRHDKSRLISNPFGYAARAWINILRIHRDYDPLKFFGQIGGFFLVVGFILGLFLVSVHLESGLNARHMGLMVLDIITIMIGVQVVIFGFIADMINKN